jgi:hypothetical protein
MLVDMHVMNTDICVIANRQNESANEAWQVDV